MNAIYIITAGLYLTLAYLRERTIRQLREHHQKMAEAWESALLEQMNIASKLRVQREIRPLMRREVERN